MYASQYWFSYTIVYYAPVRGDRVGLARPDRGRSEETHILMRVHGISSSALI